MKLRKKLLFTVFTLAVVVVGVLAINIIPLREDVSPEGYPIGIKELDPKTTAVEVSADQAIETVRRLWPVPHDAEVREMLLTDEMLGKTFWLLTWRVDDDIALAAQIDADSGEMFSLLDFRYDGKKDNLGNTTIAAEIGQEMLKKMGMPANKLSEPTVTINKALGIGYPHRITYSVLWYQVHENLPVLDGYVLVNIDPETLKPVGFAKGLINTEGIDTRPDVSMNKATNAAKGFIEAKGYEVKEVIDVELVIGRPNYYWEGTPRELGEPTLLWLVTIKTDLGSSAEIWVDAYTGEVVGGDQTR